MKTPYSGLLEKELASFIDPDTGIVSADHSSLICCPICRRGVKSQKELFIKRGYRFVACNECGLIFCNPSVKNSIAARELYDNAPSIKCWAKILQTKDQINNDMALYDSILDLAKLFIKGEHPKYLDVSMRGGLAARYFNKRNSCCDFYDFSKITRELGKKAWPNAKFYESFDSILRGRSAYDVVISMEAIEHFISPRIFMENISKILVRGGVFCGVLSNTESMLVRSLGAESPLFDGLYQKYFFNTGSLKRLSKEFGFTAKSFKATSCCSEKVENFFNRMIAKKESVDSERDITNIDEIIKKSDTLGYKLLFAAAKES